MVEAVLVMGSFLLVVILTVIPAIVVNKFMHKTLNPVPVEYKPPKGINSAEAGYIYFTLGGIGTKNDLKGVISLLPYLASKGYLRIAGVRVGQDNNKDDSVYILKDYDGDNDAERAFMDFLKKISGPTNEPGAASEVSLEKLRSEFTRGTNMVNEGMRKKFRRVEFAHKSEKYKLLWVFYYLIIASISFPAAYCATDGGRDFYGMLTVMGVVVTMMMAPVITSFMITSFMPWSKNAFFGRIIGEKITLSGVVYCVLFVAPFWPFTVFFWGWSGLWQNIGYIVLYALGFVCACIVMYCIETMRVNRADFDNEWYRKIFGFREYLEKVEKSRIQVLAKESPELYYEMMAYAYALDVANDWAGEFEIGIDVSEYSEVYIENGGAYRN